MKTPSLIGAILGALSWAGCGSDVPPAASIVVGSHSISAGMYHVRATILSNTCGELALGPSESSVQPVWVSEDGITVPVQGGVHMNLQRTFVPLPDPAEKLSQQRKSCGNCGYDVEFSTSLVLVSDGLFQVHEAERWHSGKSDCTCEDNASGIVPDGACEIVVRIGYELVKACNTDWFDQESACGCVETLSCGVDHGSPCLLCSSSHPSNWR